MRWLLFFLCLFVAAHAYGGSKSSSDSSDKGLNYNDTESLQNTQEVLNDPNLRKKAIQENEKTQKAHAYVEKVAGKENVDDMYGLSSDIFAYITAKYGGDTEKLQKVLLEAQTNPEAFYNSLPDDLKGKVRGIAAKVPQPTQPAH